VQTIYDVLSDNLELEKGAWIAALVMVTSFSDDDAAVEKSAGISTVDAPPSCVAALSSGMSSIIVLSDNKDALLCGAQLRG
jgi:hypothetical protein